MNRYFLPTEVIFGRNVLDELPNVVKRYDASNILLVTGRNSMAKSGATQKVRSMLSDHQITLYDQAASNSPEEIDTGTALALESSAELIIGLGGGSAMDVAKCIAALAKNSGKIIEFLQKEKVIANASLPLIQIPSTSGTGSEVTKWATIWDGPKKYSLTNNLMYANVAIVDPLLAITMPKAVTASTGMDALSQAVEAYWSINSNTFSDLHAKFAIGLINNYLEKVCAEPDNLSYREMLSLAALESGLAFSQTETTACHAVSYPMTGHFGVKHGHACGLTIPVFLKYNSQLIDESESNDPRGPGFVRTRIQEIAQIFGYDSVAETANRITSIMKKIGLSTTLSGAGVENVELVIRESFQSGRVANNPRLVTENNLRELLAEIN